MSTECISPEYARCFHCDTVCHIYYILNSHHQLHRKIALRLISLACLLRFFHTISSFPSLFLPLTSAIRVFLLNDGNYYCYCFWLLLLFRPFLRVCVLPSLESLFSETVSFVCLSCQYPGAFSLHLFASWPNRTRRQYAGTNIRP